MGLTPEQQERLGAWQKALRKKCEADHAADLAGLERDGASVRLVEVLADAQPGDVVRYSVRRWRQGVRARVTETGVVAVVEVSTDRLYRHQAPPPVPVFLYAVRPLRKDGQPSNGHPVTVLEVERIQEEPTNVE